MTEVTTDSVRILDHLNFQARCEKWAHADERRCQQPAAALLTFRNLSEVVVSRLACAGCWSDLESEGRVYKAVKL